MISAKMTTQTMYHAYAPIREYSKTALSTPSLSARPYQVVRSFEKNGLNAKIIDRMKCCNKWGESTSCKKNWLDITSITKHLIFFLWLVELLNNLRTIAWIAKKSYKSRRFNNHLSCLRHFVSNAFYSNLAYSIFLIFLRNSSSPTSC